ncbi:N-acetyltransferase eco [Phlebotomus papatasi]|uniref:N-acetyltransferase eco n=1 Tax=Phlebotomus papatasi TaxID=29031 RepID=UPI00248431E4|nr:N-acetyltransferase eco [Phlebotomus papatasi]
MEVTPEKPVADSSRGSRHTPTPQMSERKRSLFGRCNTANMCLTVDEDSDLGPMSPIRYSPVEEEDLANDGLKCSFRNILRVKSTSPDIDEASNISSVISDQASKIPDLLKSFNSEDLQEKDKENCPEASMKTPEVDKQNYCRDLRISFKKSLILGDIGIPQALAGKGTRKWLAKWNGDNEEQSPNGKVPKPDGEWNGENPKAKTSLSFEPPAISPLRFYTPDVTKTNRRVVFMHTAATTGKRYSKGAKKVGLINKGVRHKITKPSLKAIHKAQEKKSKVVKKAEEKVKENGKEQISTSQIERVNRILKMAQNPIEMARPLCRESESDEEVEEGEEVEEEMCEEEVPVSSKKFFKTGTKRTKKYQLTNTLSATVDRGKLSLVPLKKRKKIRRMFDDIQDSFRDERNEVNSIINQLTAEEEAEVDGIIAKIQSDPDEEFRKRLPYKTSDPALISRQKSILELLISNKKCTEETFKVFIAEPEAHKAQAARILDEMFYLTTEDSTAVTEKTNEKVFPIFQKEFQPQEENVKDGHGKRPVKRLWRPIGSGQMQIDAGQKEFGAKYCSECNLVYSMHEPEEEKLHQDFHNALNCINFRGWQTENVVLNVPEWGPKGRVICVQNTDSKPKISRVKELIEIVDAELGAFPKDIPPKAITYLAVAYQQIVGVCVAEPISSANRLVQRNGVDYFSEESFPAHCGILKLWTALPFRGQGVARQLLKAVQIHFVFGHVLTFDQIAFSSPTEAGRNTAQKLSGRVDFLVYP